MYGKSNVIVYVYTHTLTLGVYYILIISRLETNYVLILITLGKIQFETSKYNIIYNHLNGNYILCSYLYRK